MAEVKSHNSRKHFYSWIWDNCDLKRVPCFHLILKFLCFSAHWFLDSNGKHIFLFRKTSPFSVSLPNGILSFILATVYFQSKIENNCINDVLRLLWSHWCSLILIEVALQGNENKIAVTHDRCEKQSEVAIFFVVVVLYVHSLRMRRIASSRETCFCFYPHCLWLRNRFRNAFRFSFQILFLLLFALTTISTFRLSLFGWCWMYMYFLWSIEPWAY